MRNPENRIKINRLTRRDTIFFVALILLNILSASPIKSQQLIERVKSFNTRNFKETLYIRTDRDIYVAGEQVWLKIYKINGLSNIPDNLSKVVYVELLDKNNFPVRQLKVSTDGNSGPADFIIPGNISSGNYVLRAYTNWMENWPVDQFYYKYISVINPFESIDHIRLPLNSNTADSVIFFPEGGSLIAGKGNKILLKSFDKNGRPAALQNGAIVSERGDTMSIIKTDNNGLGTITITPSKSDKFYLTFIGINGSKRKILLPGVNLSGVSFRLETDQQKSEFIIRLLKSDNISLEGSGMTFAIYSSGIISLTHEIKSENDSIITVKRTEFPDGLSTFLLVDRIGNKLASRSVYKGEDSNISYKILTSSSVYPSRDKVTVDIFATDSKGNPVESDLSVSVVKSGVINPDIHPGGKGFRLSGLDLNLNSTDIAVNDYLLQVPGVTFDLVDQDKMQHDYLAEIEGHFISGFVRMKDTGEPLKNTEISLSYVGKTARCKFTKTDEKGEFYFVVKDPGLNEIVIQPVSSEITGYYVELKQPFKSTFSNYKPPVLYIDSSKIDMINNAVISMQINNIYQPFRNKQGTGAKPGFPDFYGKPENSIRMSDYIELTSVREVVKELMPNVYTMKQNGKYDFKLINKFRGQPFENKPLILVDGVPMFDIEKILNINSKEIERVDIINTRYFFSENIFDGIVSFITKKGNLSALDFDNTIFRQAYEACRFPESFYSPDYSISTLKENRIPDYRNTLYWNPEVHTGKDGKAQVEFYTSDESVGYTIVVEGISPDGKTGNSTSVLRVK